MKLSLVKQIIANKLAGDTKVPADVIVEDALYEAMYYICTMTAPSELTLKYGTDTTGLTVIRFLNSGTVVVAPEYPDLSSTVKHLQIDETLTYAAIYLALESITRDQTRKQEYKQKAEDLIGIYQSNSSLVMYGE